MHVPSSTPFTLTYPDEPTRIIRGRIEAPSTEAPGVNRELSPYVIALHGFKGFMNWGFFPELTRRIAEAGLFSIAFNVSGSGVGADLETMNDEPGFARNTVSRELEDVNRVREFARSGVIQGLDPTRGGLFGHSRGGGGALLHAASHGDYRAVATWAAIDSYDRYDELTKAAWREHGFILIRNARTGQDLRLDVTALEDHEAHREEQDILAACTRLTCPVLVAHGTADEAVEYMASQRIIAAVPEGRGRHLRCEGEGHTFGARHPWQGSPPALERLLGQTVEFLSVELRAGRSL